MRRRDSSSAGPGLPDGASPWRRRAAAVLALACGACSPVFNWREVPVGDALVVLLPCKPDHAQRRLALGDSVLELEMAGCEAGGATFAVARLPGGDAAQAEARLAAWREAARRPWAGAQLDARPWALPRAAAAPAPQALDATRPASAAGNGVAEVHLRWFARTDANGGVTLYQATVLGRPSTADAVATFFDGLRLR